MVLLSSNVVPDILSRYSHLDDGKILNLLTHIFPTQMHPYFRLSRLPSVINSFLCLVLQSLPKPTKTWTKPKPSGFAWDKWCKFLQSIFLRSDVFLNRFSRWQRKLVLFAFAQAVRQAKFCRDQRRYWLR